MHKLTTMITKLFPGFAHGFEGLNIEGMSSRSKEHNWEIGKANWREIIKLMGYEVDVKLVNPRGMSITCSMRGGGWKSSERVRWLGAPTAV